MTRKIKSIGTMLLLMVFLVNLSACSAGSIKASYDNEASATIVLKAVAQNSLSTIQQTQEPKPVLYIYHSHSFETYSDGTSIIEIGKELADYISKTYGISAIHDETKYGKQSKAQAYEDSLKGIKSALESNPEITHFIDIQRDIAPDKQIVNIDEKDMAPISLVVGKGIKYSGGEKPNYELNRTFAKAICEKLGTYPDEGFVFPLVEKDGRYNQHFPGVCALINLGLDKNSFDEATEVVPYLAEAIVSALASQ